MLTTTPHEVQFYSLSLSLSLTHSLTHTQNNKEKYVSKMTTIHLKTKVDPTPEMCILITI